MKFILFVEGHTEHKAVPAFLKRWLDSRLRQPVAIKSVRFEGWTQLVDDVSKKAQLYLNGSAHADVITVISLLDLYGPTIYPPHSRSMVPVPAGLAENHPHNISDVPAKCAGLHRDNAQ